MKLGSMHTAFPAKSVDSGNLHNFYWPTKVPINVRKVEPGSNQVLCFRGRNAADLLSKLHTLISKV